MKKTLHPNLLKGLRIGWALRSAAKKPENIRTCLICGNAFYRRGKRIPKTCSRKCYAKLISRRPSKVRGQRHYKFKGEYIAMGRVWIYAPEHPNANGSRHILRSRLVASQRLGRPLFAWETVHHINGDKLDDRPENLEVLSHPEHMSHHARIKPRHPKTKQFIKV